MASRDEIIAFADELLDLARHKDYGEMGLQVVGAAEVRKVVCGVSASRELFERAAAAGAQLVLVHHGIFWRNEPQRIDARMRGRLETLFAADMSLAGYHLALDAHPELSDSAQLAAELGVERRGAVRGRTASAAGCAEPARIEAFLARIEDVLGRAPLVFAYGPATVERVAIMSGGGGPYFLRGSAGRVRPLPDGRADRARAALREASSASTSSRAATTRPSAAGSRR